MTPEPSLMQQGLQLLYFGMGTVVVFLALLVLLTSLMSYLVKRLGLDAAPPVSQRAAPSSSPAAEPSPEVVAAISAAIHQHRRL